MNEKGQCAVCLVYNPKQIKRGKYVVSDMRMHVVMCDLHYKGYLKFKNFIREIRFLDEYGDNDRAVPKSLIGVIRSFIEGLLTETRQEQKYDTILLNFISGITEDEKLRWKELKDRYINKGLKIHD